MHWPKRLSKEQKSFRSTAAPLDFFSNDFHPQIDEVYINKRPNEVKVKGGSVKIKAPICESFIPRKFECITVLFEHF